MGQCNYCTHKDLKRWARKRKMRVVTRPHDGGIQAVLVPRGANAPDTEEFGAWYMALPTECKCHE